MPKIEVELTKEELKDLQEFQKHHKDKAKTPGEALKEMAGLENYRVLKQAFDPKRKKAAASYQDLGLPTYLPCAFAEELQRNNQTFHDFLLMGLRARKRSSR